MGIAYATVRGRRGFLVLLALLLACHTDSTPASGPTPAAEGPKADIVLITVDTTRADRIGAYGYPQAKTETLDELAARGTRFEQAYSVLPLTIPAHASILTGLYPFHHGIRSNGDSILGKEFVTLAERLHDAGWATAASVGAFVTTRQWGFNQGFDAFFDSMPEEKGKDRNFWHNERPGNEVVDDALGWLAAQPAEKPVFLWVHLYDAHFPYEPHAEQGEAFKDRPYDGEIAFLDDQIARLVGAFEGRDVLWVVIGDHGESQGDHGEIQHGLYSYNGTARVPFILSGHGVKPGVVNDAASSVDVMPSVLKLVGQPIPEGLDGRAQPGGAQVPYVESYQLTERFRLAPHRAVVADGYKLINTPQPELYDMTADVEEKSNLAAQKPDEVAKLQKLLLGMNATPPGAPGAAMDADTVAQLAALGYISGGGMTGVDIETLPDPKTYLEFLNKANHLDLATKKKGPEEGLRIVDELIKMRPEAFEMRMRRINLLGRLKRTTEIRPYLEQLTKEFPDKAHPWVTLAGMAMQDNNAEGALEMAERAVAIEPTNAPAQEAVVEALFRLRRAPDAVARATTWMAANPSNYGVAALLGQYYLGTKDLTQAETYLRIAVQGPNPRRAARAELALLALAGGFREDAYTLLEGEVADYPGNVMARRLLAKMYGEDARWLDEKLQLQALLAPRPKDVGSLVALAQCEFNLKDYATARTTLDKALALAPEDPQVLLLHANLLAKEGKRDEGYAVFQRASKLNDARLKAAGITPASPSQGAPGASEQAAPGQAAPSAPATPPAPAASVAPAPPPGGGRP